MEEEVLDRTVRRTSSGKGCVLVARYWMNNACTYPTSDVVSVRIMYFTNLFSQYKRYIIICPYMPRLDIITSKVFSLPHRYCR